MAGGSAEPVKGEPSTSIREPWQRKPRHFSAGRREMPRGNETQEKPFPYKVQYLVPGVCGTTRMWYHVRCIVD
eukprot:3941583-Rhodomonas_salina.6